MNSFQLWFDNNLEIVFFIYGLTFIIMGIAILVNPKKGSSFKLANLLWLFVTYALLHAPADFISMWMKIKGYNKILHDAHHLLTYISYLFVFEFGRRIIKTIYPELRLLNPYILTVISIILIFISYVSNNFIISMNVLFGYFIRFPGGMMAGLGLIIYYKHNSDTSMPEKFRRYFLSCGGALLAWAFFCGLIREKGAFFPSNYINIESFFNTLSVPVYLFRSVCAIIVAWSFSGILSLFNWETKEKIQGLLQKEKESKDFLDSIIKSMSDAMIVTDTKDIIANVNQATLSLLNYHEEELIGKPLSIIFGNNSSYRKTAADEIGFEGHSSTNEASFIAKNGSKIDVILSRSAIRNNKTNYITGIVVIATDITERKLMEEKIKNANIELDKIVKERTSELEKTCKDLEDEIIGRKGTEKNLSSAYALLQSIIDGIGDPILVIDKKYRVLHMNLTAREKFVSEDNADPPYCYKISHNSNIPCHKTDHPCPIDQVKKLLQPVIVVHKHLEISGEERFYEIMASPLLDDSGTLYGIIEILRDITERKQLESEILNIIEMERQRIGQDLHDDLAQNLVAIDVLCKMLHQKLKDKSLEEAIDAKEIAKFIDHALSQTRRIARGLCPVSLEPEGFLSSLKEMVHEVENVFNISCSFKSDGEILIHDSSSAIHLYHIAREAINNIIKHSMAKNIFVEIVSLNDSIQIKISDDGVGLPGDLNKKKGMGLRIMKHRADVINATLSIAKGASGGTVVKCSLNQ